jgi:hypothetical protein
MARLELRKIATEDQRRPLQGFGFGRATTAT